MIEELDLLACVAGKGGERKTQTSGRAKFEASIIATYNAYLPFYEDVVLRRLVASGCQHNILLLDSGVLVQCLSDPTARPRNAGRAYTLVPMRAPGAFHPKIALLVGKKNARIFVGSHNVTLSGFGHNRELTTQINLPSGGEDPDATLAQRVWSYFYAWLLHQGDRLPESVVEAVQKVATNFAPWLKENRDAPGDLKFFGVGPKGESLWDLVRPTLPEKARRVIVSGPFFDRKAEFLRILSHDLQAPELIVGVDQGTVELYPEALPDRTRVVDASLLGRGSGYLHAKTIWIESESGDVVLITGSANLSTAAWTEGPTKRNAEAVLVHHGDAARVLAESLGIASILSMPELQDEALRAISERVAKSRVTARLSSSAPVVAAEALEREIVLPGPGFTSELIKSVSCLYSDNGSWKHAEETICDTRGLHIMLSPEDVVRIGFVEVGLVNGKSLRALVHHPALIARLSRTSTQRRFREVLDSLESEGPDLATVIRLAESLIFDGEEFQTETRTKGRCRKGENPGDTVPESLSISMEETKRHKKGIRELRGNDLAYVIDILIHRLGFGLQNAAEQLEGTGPSEEEQIGADEDLTRGFELLPVDITKVCQRKVRTLVSRMLRQFEMSSRDVQEAHRRVSQLLAVLAVIREVRAQDSRLSGVTRGQSLVPEEQRKRLLDGSLSALFGRNYRLFKAGSQAFEGDPEKDLARLLGLLLWLSADSGLDARTIDQLAKWDVDQRRQSLLNLARLLELCVAAGKEEQAFSEAEHSIWRTVQESEKGAASSWVKYHREWSRALADLKDTRDVWKRDGLFKPGTLGIAVYEPQKKMRIVLGVSGTNIVLAELGEKSNEAKLPKEKRDQVQFKIGSVEITEFPRIPY